MKRFIPLLGLAILLLLPLQAVRASGGERITNFQSVASLGTDGVLHVIETITVDFGNNVHHGIYRNIPVIERSGKDAYYYRFKLNGVSSSTGAPAGIASLSQQADNEQIQIGDANKTVQGIQSYTINYQLWLFVLHSGSFDRVNLNITGQNWDYPIDHATLHLTLPVAPVDTPACYTGTTGSTANDCYVDHSGTTVDVVSITGFAPGSGMTVDMNLPGGSFNSYLVANQRPPLSTAYVILIGLVGTAWLVGLYILLGFIRRAVANTRLKRAQTLVAQYEAPDGLTPGQIGLLVDSKSDMTEFTATVIDLAVRGYIKITRLETKRLGLFKQVDYQFNRLKTADGLSDYESSVYDLMMALGDESKLSSLTASSRGITNQQLILQMRTDLGGSLKTAGYYGSRADLVGAKSWGTVILGMILSGVALTGATAPGVIAFLAGVVMLSYGFIRLRNYPALTAAGATEWAKVEGFKLYLSVAEKDRINFTDAPERTPELFNKLLPYAVALSVEQKWAKQFDGIDVTPANGWYGGYDGTSFNSAAFATSFAATLGSSMNSSFVGSSGSGGAGGGGGGGGGGGW